jgi:enoyl-CoA hydratase/carnithine racemase
LEVKVNAKKVVLKIEGDIAIIELNNPPVNALNEQVINELSDLFDLVAADATIRSAVITSGITGVFIAGADIKGFVNKNISSGEALSARGHSVFIKLLKLPKPVIAAVNGLALGGGLELSLFCDIRIFSEKAKIGLPETTLGLMPGYGGTQILPNLIGAGAAKKMIYTGELMSASDAKKAGIADIVIEHDAVLEEAIKLSRKMNANAPLAIKAVKQAIFSAQYSELERMLEIESKAFGALCGTEDKIEGVTAFLEKRTPAFKGC